jgi:hypothetical protein
VVRRTRRRLLAAGLAAASLAPTACGGGGDDTSPVRALGSTFMPGEIRGLELADEDVTDLLGDVRRPYVDATSLYSLRDDEDQLQATMQVVTFRNDAPVDDGDFRRSVIERIGSSAPQPFRVGGREVYLTTGRRQRLAVWFGGEHLFVLAVRDEYAAPRALIRAAMEVQP